MAHLKRAYLETHLKVNFSLDKSKNYTRWKFLQGTTPNCNQVYLTNGHWDYIFA